MTKIPCNTHGQISSYEGISLIMDSTNQNRRYNVTLYLIGWAYT